MVPIIQHLRTLGYKFIPATNTKPKRIRLEDRRFDPPHRIYISWDDPIFETIEDDNTYSRVVVWAKSLGFEALGYNGDFQTITMRVWRYPMKTLKEGGQS